ncbi:hypothetical protein [Cellulosilyticum sp. I15G10I2]|uniref:hypothetical protein n=1 Tax=Cellulosilyticum sp. I15G10I2 TaxID=1892843 RepID=UPI00085CAD7A|nr:hypothetical protein [Cellulosilyticum sp. I15G10I2]
MRIYIKEDKNIIFIPIPLVLLKAVFSIMEMPIVKRHIPERKRYIIQDINFNQLKQCVDMLKEYKGLKLVDIKDSKGNRIKITI